ncbi:MAG: 3-alpha,7-alpha,12-alpha-trihydroxy-5-beta-cholest-24-enoyl-CoA hydratase [Firmicutes bacterium]|nr:3-alpha,7-alpha,12-alpha-trihydroxy-5-beta-cholest-24-enoyl-CoA hydratase [Bacillota bacterium]
MPIDRQIVGKALKPLDYIYQNRDIILYALGIGAGAADEDLKFVYEGDLEVLPTFGVVPPFPALTGIMDLEGVDINPAMLLHGEQYLELYKPIPAEGKLTSYPKVAALYDKGKGALIEIEVVTRDKKDEPLFLNKFSVFVRGEGGFGGERGPDPGHVPPEREPDKSVSLPTLPQQALLYRLSGDFNPLHADPAFAAMGGFSKPILHGLCTMGFACRAVLREYANNDPSRFKAMKVRFSRHVFPGKSIITEMWSKKPDKIILRSKTAERGEYCLTNAAVWLNP